MINEACVSMLRTLVDPPAEPAASAGFRACVVAFVHEQDCPLGALALDACRALTGRSWADRQHRGRAPNAVLVDAVIGCAERSEGPCPLSRDGE